MRLRNEVYYVIMDALENGIDDPGEFDRACRAAAGIVKLFCNYVDKHGDVALSVGAEAMYQDDSMQVDALKLVGNALDELEEFAEYNE